MKTFCLAMLLMGFTGAALAQESPTRTRLIADPFETSKDSRFRIYPTYRPETQIVLDSATGTLWQVESSEYVSQSSKAVRSGRYPLIETTSAAGRAGRFALVERQAGHYTLIDQDAGDLWQVSVASGRPERSTVSKLDEVQLPDVEAP